MVHRRQSTSSSPALASVVSELWLDRLGGEHGMGEWTHKAMTNGISSSEVIVAVVSPSYVKSKNCGYEMKLAAEHKKTIIPIKFNIPFADWPPSQIGETKMNGQFKDGDDVRLFVDCTDRARFDIKFKHEIAPRLERPSSALDPSGHVQGVNVGHGGRKPPTSSKSGGSPAGANAGATQLAPGEAAKRQIRRPAPLWDGGRAVLTSTTSV